MCQASNQTPQDAILQESEILDAPYVHQHSEPKHHALLLRTAEYAKRPKKHCLWCRAHDTIMDKTDRPKDPSEAAGSADSVLEVSRQPE